VEREVRANLECGVLAHGFIRVHCDACGHDRLVAFSRKGRGFCPFFADQRLRARKLLGIREGQCGSVTFIQRFGSALNLAPHFHTLVFDGVYPAPSHRPGEGSAIGSSRSKRTRRVWKPGPEFRPAVVMSPARRLPSTDSKRWRMDDSPIASRHPGETGRRMS
jgi:hypothetical protein